MLKLMLRETICKYDFQRKTALQGRYNVETILQSFGTMSQQCCDAVLSNRVNSSSGCRFWEYAEKRVVIVLESTRPRFSLVVLANFKVCAKIASIVIKVYVLDFFGKKFLVPQM